MKHGLAGFQFCLPEPMIQRKNNNRNGRRFNPVPLTLGNSYITIFRTGGWRKLEEGVEEQFVKSLPCACAPSVCFDGALYSQAH